MKEIIFTMVVFFSSFSLSSAQWYEQEISTSVDGLFSIDFLNENTGMTCGAVFIDEERRGRAFYTTNAGLNWEPAEIPDSLYDLTSCSYINEEISYMGGNYYDSARGIPYVTGLMLKSTNNGRSWSTFKTFPPEYSWFVELDFINENVGYAIAQIVWGVYRPISCILKTTDAGTTWITQLTLDSLSDLWSIEHINENVIFASGGNGHDEFDYTGIVVRSTDGGAHWERHIFNHITIIEGVSFADQNTGVFVARGDGGGLIYRTTNQGLNWTGVDSLPMVHQLFRGINFYPGTGIGFAYGYQNTVGGFVFRTSDYGSTWERQEFNTTRGPYAGVMVSTSSVYIVATGVPLEAEILHTTNGGSVFVQNTNTLLPDFELFQNYPNPFNPKTNIRYSLKTAQSVSLKVFDILGNEVAVLINKKQPAGQYSIDWNASDFSSGTYFYVLKTESHSNTKKMILLK